MTLTFWEKLTGVFEYPAFCPRCGLDVQRWKTRDVIRKFKCGFCDLVAMVTTGQVPRKCPGCGNGTTGWKHLGIIAETEKVPGEFCGQCSKLVQQFQKEIEKGGVAWRCVSCKGEGVEKADSKFAQAVRKEHPGGGVVQLSRTNGCPLCSHLVGMEN